jgi:hypothetical protein
MSSTNKTTHYDLSQFTANDIPAWLSDYNADMGKIDTGIYNASTSASEATSKADNAVTQISELDSTVTKLNGKVDTNTSNITKAQNDITTLQSAVSSNAQAIQGNTETIQSIINQDNAGKIAKINNLLNRDKINVSITSFTNDSTYTNYKFRASYSWSGIDSTFIPTGSIAPTNEYAGAILLEATTNLLYVYTETDPSTLVFDWLSVRKENV